jgi:hypothetical protein
LGLARFNGLMMVRTSSSPSVRDVDGDDGTMVINFFSVNAVLADIDMVAFSGILEPILGVAVYEPARYGGRLGKNKSASWYS